MAATRYEIHVEIQINDTEVARALHWAASGPEERVERDARQEFTRVKEAMQGGDTGIFADHFMSVELLKGDAPALTLIETYIREPNPDR